eukprot:9428897-Pyramimonas_sp.AAC.1
MFLSLSGPSGALQIGNVHINPLHPPLARQGLLRGIRGHVRGADQALCFCGDDFNCLGSGEHRVSIAD